MTDHNYDYMAYLIGDKERWGKYKYEYKPALPKNSSQQDKDLKCKFNVGDRVRLKNGTAEIEVTGLYIDTNSYNYSYRISIDGKYINSDNTVVRRNQDDFVKYSGESKMTTNTNKLYTWKQDYTTLDTPSADLYGHYLATNSQGEWVMEVKGSGQIMAVAKDKVQEVLPYTIGVRFNNNGTTYHYLADKDKFTEGFYLVKDMSSSGWQIARVVNVDTKSSKATVEFNPLGKLAVDLY